jgi:hypothetical protein
VLGQMVSTYKVCGLMFETGVTAARCLTKSYGNGTSKHPGKTHRIPMQGGYH